MNITGRPVAAKAPRAKPDKAYLAGVREMPCVCCGAMPVEAHHCRDTPDYGEQGLYQRLPGAVMKSGDRDAIPLCPFHHRMFHENRACFHEAFGRDYGFIPQTRAALSDMEVDF